MNIFCPRPVTPVVDLNHQSVEIPNSGGARQSILVPLGKTTDSPKDVTTLFEMMEKGMSLSNDGPCLGWRGVDPKYYWLNYSQVIEKAKHLASGLVKIGMEPGQSSFIGIYSQNCVEWVLTEHACYNQSAINVPLYDTLGKEARSFIINQAEINIIVCDKDSKAKTLLQDVAETPSLKHIIVVGGIGDDVRRLAEECGVALHFFKDIEALGEKNPVPVLPPRASDLATICYTSGTTGLPKGVMLTHENFIISAAAGIIHAGEEQTRASDIYFSFLPLAHALERHCEVEIFMSGARVGFFRGDVKLILEDLQAMKPTLFVAVPRVFNRIYDRVHDQVRGSWLKSLLLRLAVYMKSAEIKRGIIRSNSIWDFLVFGRIRKGMGGRIRGVVSGAAPLSGEVLNFIRCAVGCAVIEGYGQTETTAPATCSVYGDATVGHVGPPLPCCHVKLIDVPDMEYYATNGEGEICIKGGNVTKGYFKNPEKTAETIDGEGWLHTGDIGTWLPNGTLKIIDRKKNMFKLAQGEYISPEKIERIYGFSNFVGQIFVHGESLKSCLVGIVVPNEEFVPSWCEKNGIKGSWEEMCKSKVLKDAILDDIIMLGKKADLLSFEQVKAIHVHPTAFTIEDDLITPTMKLKRPAVKQKFDDVIDEMYRSLS